MRASIGGVVRGTESRGGGRIRKPAKNRMSATRSRCSAPAPPRCWAVGGLPSRSSPKSTRRFSSAPGLTARRAEDHRTARLRAVRREGDGLRGCSKPRRTRAFSTRYAERGPASTAPPVLPPGTSDASTPPARDRDPHPRTPARSNVPAPRARSCRCSGRSGRSSPGG